MSNEDRFDVFSVTTHIVVIVGLLAVAVHLIPLLIRILWAVLPLLVILWFIALVIRGIVRVLLS